MRAGKLDRLVSLYHRVLTQDAQGEQIATYPTAYGQVWAEKLDQRAREYFAAQGTQAEATTRFRIRWRSDVLMTDRVALDGVNYDIVQISEIGRRQGLELFVTSAPA